MFRTRKQSTTSYPFGVLMRLSDGSGYATGKTVTCAISKNGGTFASSAGSVSEVSSGFYVLAGNATDRNTLGSNVYKFSATGCEDAFVQVEIVPYDVFAVVDANVEQIQGDIGGATGTKDIGNWYNDNTAMPETAKTDNLPASPAATGDIPSAATNASTLLAVTNGAATVAAQLQHLDADVSAVGGGSGSGNGDIAVNHSYGSTDAYRVLNSETGEPIDDVLVAAYEGSTATGTPDAQTRTGSDGRWISSLMLDAGTYTLVFSKAGVMETTSVSLTVTEP